MIGTVGASPSCSLLSKRCCRKFSAIDSERSKFSRDRFGEVAGIVGAEVIRPYSRFTWNCERVCPKQELKEEVAVDVGAAVGWFVGDEDKQEG